MKIKYELRGKYTQFGPAIRVKITKDGKEILPSASHPANSYSEYDKLMSILVNLLQEGIVKGEIELNIPECVLTLK